MKRKRGYGSDYNGGPTRDSELEKKESEVRLEFEGQ